MHLTRLNSVNYLPSTKPAFGSWTIPQLSLINEGGFQSKFTLHYPGTCQSFPNLNIQMAMPQLQRAKLIVEGDLHASTRKLLELLILSDLVNGVNPQQAKRLFDILRSLEACSPFTPGDIAKMTTLCQEFGEAIKPLKWADDTRSIILIGDIVSDRGADDRATLALLSHLNTGNVNRIKTLVGNHDLNIANPENQIMPGQAISSFAGLIENEPLIRAQYNNFLMNSNFFCYIPEHNAFFAHAPISGKLVDKLIEHLVERNKLPKDFKQTDITANTMGQFVDIVNQFYKETIQKHLASPDDETKKDMRILAALTWGRSDLKDKNEFPFKHIDGLKLIHGHDSSSKTESPYAREVKLSEDPMTSMSHSVICLDNQYLKTKTDETKERPLFIIPS